MSTGDIARHSFAIVRRGFDIDEVKTYLQTVARSIEVLEEREQELRDAVNEAEERAAHPVIDEATLTASLGQHSAQILRHAHDEAARIVVQAQEGAATLLREAQSTANEIQERSEAASAERVAEAELMVANARQEARQEVEKIRTDAVAAGEAVIASAKEEGRALLEQVQEARKRVIGDLATRRKALSIQIEQLRAARDEMAAAVQGVRFAIDDILSQMERSDDAARAAAVAAGDLARLHMPRELPDVEESADAEGVDPLHEVPAPSVDELFARIRAATDLEGEGAAPASDAEVGGPESEAEPGAESEAEPEGPDHDLIVRRDELLSPISAQLSRHVKRALGDDQNRLLDVLRSTPNLSGEELLGPEDVHLSTFTSAAQGHLAEAFAAGSVFGGAAEGSIPPGADAEQAAAGLSRTIVSKLRQRLLEGTDGGEGASEQVGAAFREWRGERIERLVGDFAVQAFSAGVAAAVSPDGRVRWVLTSSDGCSDCDDNALAGAVPLTEGFPTGHAYPPAHSGCRCLVAPDGG